MTFFIKLQLTRTAGHHLGCHSYRHYLRCISFCYPSLDRQEGHRGQCSCLRCTCVSSTRDSNHNGRIVRSDHIDHIRSGLGRPRQTIARAPARIQRERANHYLRIQFGIIILFWTCVWAVKLSILVFYKSLFDRLSRTYLYAWWAVVAFVGLTYVGCWALQFVSCSPLADYFKIGWHAAVISRLHLYTDMSRRM